MLVNFSIYLNRHVFCDEVSVVMNMLIKIQSLYIIIIYSTLFNISSFQLTLFKRMFIIQTNSES